MIKYRKLNKSIKTVEVEIKTDVALTESRDC